MNNTFKDRSLFFLLGVGLVLGGVALAKPGGQIEAGRESALPSYWVFELKPGASASDLKRQLDIGVKNNCPRINTQFEFENSLFVVMESE